MSDAEKTAYELAVESKKRIEGYCPMLGEHAGDDCQCGEFQSREYRLALRVIYEAEMMCGDM